jgi:chaperone modulatory protein CbpM
MTMTEQITTLEATWLSVTEFTQVAGLQQTELVALVEVGVLKPIGQSLNDWSFDSNAMTLARRLRRIREDLELDLDTHALALGFRLLERITELESALNRAQVAQLQDRG